MASLAAHRTLAAALDAAGRACQVGFQALGSVGLDPVPGRGGRRPGHRDHRDRVLAARRRLLRPGAVGRAA